ncbi:hypothetical protein [Streptomyces sp. NPDC094049]|uniref:hypothetical protein n=1 Tax=Streptomyces sp. NPDC094049 TaxID=3154987 RepID=UPI00332F67CD
MPSRTDPEDSVVSRPYATVHGSPVAARTTAAVVVDSVSRRSRKAAGRACAARRTAPGTAPARAG